MKLWLVLAVCCFRFSFSKASMSSTNLFALMATGTLFGGVMAFTPVGNVIMGGGSESVKSSIKRTVFGAASEETADSNQEGLRIGFLGCGTIACAIATGMATQESIPIQSIAVTRRSRAKSAALEEKFPNLVSVHDVAQEILDKSDVVFVCVLPQQASELLKELAFDEGRHTLVSVVSTAKIYDLVSDSKLPPSRVSKMICLPSIARHQGVCLHCSPAGKDERLTKLFDALGGVVTLADEEQLAAAMMTTCVMGPMYGIMRQGRDWLVRHGGMSKSDASYLVSKQYLGMVQDAERDCRNPSRLDDLIEEQTPGGINEQALGNLEKLGGLDAYDDVMDAIFARIKGETDGSVEGPQIPQ